MKDTDRKTAGRWDLPKCQPGSEMQRAVHTSECAPLCQPRQPVNQRRGRGTSGEPGSPEEWRLHRGPIRTALPRSQLSSQTVMFTILKPFAVHATEERKHLLSDGFPFSDDPFPLSFPESKRGKRQSPMESVSRSHDGEAEGTTDIVGLLALGVPGVSLNWFYKMKTEVRRSAALLRSRSPHPEGQRVPATPHWTCLSNGKPRGCLSPGTPAARPGMGKGQSKHSEKQLQLSFDTNTHTHFCLK